MAVEQDTAAVKTEQPQPSATRARPRRTAAAPSVARAAATSAPEEPWGRPPPDDALAAVLARAVARRGSPRDTALDGGLVQRMKIGTLALRKPATAAADVNAWKQSIRAYIAEAEAVIARHKAEMNKLNYPQQTPVVALEEAIPKAKKLLSDAGDTTPGAGVWKTLAAADLSPFPDTATAEKAGFEKARTNLNAALSTAIDDTFDVVLKHRYDTLPTGTDGLTEQQAGYKRLRAFKSEAGRWRMRILAAANADQLAEPRKWIMKWIDFGTTEIHARFADYLPEDLPPELEQPEESTSTPVTQTTETPVVQDADDGFVAVAKKKKPPPNYKLTVHEWLTKWGFQMSKNVYVLDTDSVVRVGTNTYPAHISINRVDVAENAVKSSRDQSLKTMFNRFHVTTEVFGKHASDKNPHIYFVAGVMDESAERWGSVDKTSWLTARADSKKIGAEFVKTKNAWLAAADT